MQIMESYEKPNSILYEKAKKFALSIIELCDVLSKEGSFRLADQLLRSGTSIGANVREASRAESGLDFIHKMNIALKECEESEYWLELLFESNRIKSETYLFLTSTSKELEAMLVASINTKRKTINKERMQQVKK